jgi:uncharacterized protein YndB with AHSA1/START domain
MKMVDILHRVGAVASLDDVYRAIATPEGIAGWWTTDVSFAGGEGAVMTLGFPVAPRPFELRVDEVSDQRVRWSSVGEFPPHWAGTEIVWTFQPSENGRSTTVHFAHDGWASDEGPLPSAAMTWGILMTSLKRYVETGVGTPLYSAR